MSDTTTVRVRRSTRERLNNASAAQETSVDEIITQGLAALDREAWRREAEMDARRVAADAQDRREVAEALIDLTGE
jgi:hypothetical protein